MKVVIGLFARLRWRMLRGALRSPGAQKWTVLLGLVVSVLFGIIGAIGLAVVGRSLATGSGSVDDRDALFVIAPALLTVVIAAVGIIAGVSQSIDPRVLATEPLTDRHLAVGLLTSAAVGPPGLAAGLLGIGLWVGGIDGWSSIPVVTLAAIAFLATLLLVSRSTINALGLFANRYPRAGQLLVGIFTLVFYLGFQVLAQVAPRASNRQSRDLSRVLQFTPPGQLGKAIATASSAPFEAVGHLALGGIWLAPLAWLFVWTTRRLLVSQKVGGLAGTGHSADTHRPRLPIRGLVRRMCGPGMIGAVAWRGILTRVRTPRTALETFTGGGVGLAVVLVPALLRDGVGGGAVLAGGFATQLAVLFIAGNSFGADGPALSSELLCGVEPDVLVRGKARSIVVVTTPIAAIGPLLAAAITGEWAFLPAGLLVAGGGLFAGAGAAMVQSTVLPIAIPESDNPFASGDSGKGCFSGLILGVILLCLAIVNVPVAIPLVWAVDRGSLPLVTVLALVAAAVGATVQEVCLRYAIRKWRRSEPEIYGAVIPAR